MKNILTYKLFENVPFTRANIQKSIRDKINEKEVESIITDICADFMDEYNVAIHFDWGWLVCNNNPEHNRFRKDSIIDHMREKVFLNRGLSTGKENKEITVDDIKKYLQEVDESTTRFVQVMFDRFGRGTSSLNIWKRGFDIDYLNIMDFVRNYFQNIKVEQYGNITPEVLTSKFNVIFK